MARVSERITLPSNGILYPIKDITIQSLTMKEYKMLMSSNSEGSIYKILQSCIVQEDENNYIDINNLCDADQIYILVKLRALCFMDTFTVPITCDKCNKTFNYEISLNKLDVYDLDSDFNDPIILPDSKDKIVLTIPTTKDKDEIKELSKTKSKKFNLDYDETLFIYGLCNNIKTVNDKVLNKEQLYTYINDLSAKDGLYIANKIDNIQIGIDPRLEAKCPDCGEVIKFTMPFNLDFFRPNL